MNAYELADELKRCIDDGSTDLVCVYGAVNMLRQQADRIADHEKTFNEMCEIYEKQLDKQADRIVELEKEVLMWENAEVPTEVMADLIQELERRGFITTPQIKELSDEEIIEIRQNTKASSTNNWADSLAFARAILKKASEK